MAVPPALAGIATAIAALGEAWTSAVPAGAHGPADSQSAVDAMTEAGILAVSDALAVLRREVDSVFVPVAGGIANRSRPELGSEGLARKTGHRTPVKLIAAATGGHAGDAARLVKVAEATRERETFAGTRAPSRHPVVSAAIAEASISIDAASAITTMLDKVALRAHPTQLAEAEQLLTEQARILSLQELAVVIRRAEAWLDPDGVAPKLDDMRAARSFTMREDASGLFVFSGKADPENAAPIKAALEGIVTHQLRTSRGHNHPGDGSDTTGGPECVDSSCTVPDASTPATADDQGAMGREQGAVAEETRSIPQLQLDALAALCRHALGCDSSGLPLATTTVIVRVPLEVLTEGVGTATIDGITQPIDATTARRMAANANVIPFVLGGDGEVLECGRAKRLFTAAQRLVLEERDGGCAFCGLPGKYAEGHHLWWWSHGGPTDVRNGVLLCTSCHHRVHNDGWEIRIETPPGGDPLTGTVWFIPPATLDPSRTPRIGGRRRFDWMLAA